MQYLLYRLAILFALMKDTRYTFRVIICGVVMLAACSSDRTLSPAPATNPKTPITPDATAAATTDSVVTTDSTKSVDTTVAVTLTESTIPVVEPEFDALITFDDGPCALGPVPNPGSITFVAQDRLWELSPDVTSARCVAELDGQPADNLRWSPSGAAVLLGSNRVLDESGQRDTGYLAGNNELRWSYPTGKALIAPAVKDGALLWRSSTDASSRLDISFLDVTTTVAYHPAGKNIFAAGTDAAGNSGLFLASNRGENARMVASLDDPNTSITEIVADVGGVAAYFVHDHGTFTEVHRLAFPGQEITDLARYEEPIAQLTIGAGSFSPIAFRVGDCAGKTRTEVQFAEKIEIGAGTALDTLSTSPIGWIDGSHVVIAARTSGCTGPADLWIAGLDGSAQLVVSGVDNAAVRAQVTGFGEMIDDANAVVEG
jgi:hypothetical protein